MSLKFSQIQPLVSMVTERVMMAVFHLILFILAGNDESSVFEIGLIRLLTAELAALEGLKKLH